MSPLIVALICTNKIQKALFLSLESICLQDYQNIIVAIHLDGITCSNTHIDHIKRFCDSYGRTSLIYQSIQQIGLTKGLVRLQQNVSADYFARLDTGDLWSTNKISKQVELCLKDNYVIVGTRSEYINSNLTTIGFSELLPVDSSQIIYRIQSFKGLYDHSSILFSSNFQYDSHWFFSQDMKLYVDIANSGNQFGYIPEALTKILYNPNGITINKRPLQLYYEKEARKRFGNMHLQSHNPKNYSELRPPNNLFAYFYRRFIISIYIRKYTKAYLFLAFACLADMRLLTYYLDRLIFAFGLMFR